MIPDISLKIISLGYAASGIISTLAYWPTIKDLHHHKKPSANSTSYILWTATAFITLLYSLLVLPDLLFQFVSGANFAACAIILALSVGLQRRSAIRNH
jgi:hypothetical protein